MRSLRSFLAISLFVITAAVTVANHIYGWLKLEASIEQAIHQEVYRETQQAKRFLEEAANQLDDSFSLQLINNVLLEDDYASFSLLAEDQLNQYSATLTATSTLADLLHIELVELLPRGHVEYIDRHLGDYLISTQPVCLNYEVNCFRISYQINLNERLDSAYAQLTQQSLFNLLFGLLGASILLIAIHARFTRRLARALSVLTRWKMGDLELRIGLDGHDELTTISDAVDEIVNQLSDERVALVESQQLNQAIIASAEYAIITLDLDGIIRTMNSAAEELLEYRREELVGSHSPLVFEPLNQENHQTITEFLLRRRHSPSQTNTQAVFAQSTFISKSGRTIPVRLALSSLFDQDRHHSGFVCIAYNISEQVEQELQLRLSSSVFSHSSQAILIVNRQQLVEDCNARFLEIFQVNRTETVGHSARNWLSSEHSSAFFNYIWRQTIKSGEWSGEVTQETANGDIFPSELIMYCVNSPSGDIEHVIMLSQDITQKKNAEERLEQMAYLDSLTSLPNRFLFKDRLERAMTEAIRENTVVALMFIDLDRFKMINDNYGHEVGDELLQLVAARLKQTLRPHDAICRLGGDEFTVILKQLPVNSARDLAAKTADRLVNALEVVFEIGARKIYVSASIGITLFPENGTEFSELTRNADTAMYIAKEMDQCRYAFFEDQMLDINRRRLKLETALRRDISNNALRIAYQPLIDFTSSSIIGVEALCRWECSEFGIISPEEFIPIAEDMGMIDELGSWVMNQAMKDFADWSALLKSPAYLSINASPQQFRADSFSDYLNHARLQFNVSPEHIQIEITESVLLDHAPATTRQIRELRQAGIRIAIDDFGTGYSSLSYLKRFPISALKIDKSFVQHAANDPTDLAIIRAIMAIAIQMDVSVIAEGVETQAELDLLIREAVHCGQGFFYSEPLYKEELVEFIRGFEQH
ncbi:GGDEF and EAL domain-containing protein [Umboniibacter marinipuniceus]|uniref:PAS domain S-box-containing protein/diguanylate cyclase (GGDEF)-like protein n=1 Tax=Umboniibacter marinipuniceus TaxID=569599 RepID=A0A3M0AI70_9GAMM|nr:GGDEF and EAL domain-containing protein [Umboniibacter marinipuniceus]RMA82418.1 PAS domain S-box-containing protein/diguanylate cyclase (GGDEF)-like protein [Umboniibacter marinipuniceus]